LTAAGGALAKEQRAGNSSVLALNDAGGIRA
jgi:hypothetical protein